MIIDENAIIEILNNCCSALKLCEKKKKAVLNEYKDEDMDEDIEERMNDEYEEVNDIIKINLL